MKASDPADHVLVERVRRAHEGGHIFRMVDPQLADAKMGTAFPAAQGGSEDEFLVLELSASSSGSVELEGEQKERMPDVLHVQ